MASSSFEFMRHIRLSKGVRSHATERPHPWRVSWTQTDRHIAKQAGLVRFITDHCPMLKTLRIELAVSSYTDVRQTPPQALEPLQLVLRKHVERTESLKAVGVVTAVISVLVSNNGFHIEMNNESQWHSMFDEEDVDLDLEDIPMFAREEAVARWCRTTLRESLEYGGVVRYV
jgi:hypothetical protein